jgi:hypothetical protein
MAALAEAQRTVSVRPTALKEWAVVVRALDKGDQVIVLRKGGIAEETDGFVVPHDAFHLFPTYEHQRPEDLKPRYRSLLDETTANPPPVGTLRLTNWAHVVGDLVVDDVDRLRRLTDHHVWSDGFVAQRFAWKPEVPLHVVLLRVYRLPEPLDLPMHRRYGGCRSWVALEEDVPVSGSSPVLDDGAFSRRVEAIRSALA